MKKEKLLIKKKKLRILEKDMKDLSNHINIDAIQKEFEEVREKKK